MQIVTLIGLIGLIVALLAAALHILIFWMESIAWEGPLARKAFGGTPPPRLLRLQPGLLQPLPRH